MNNTAVTALIGAGSALLGGVAGYILGRRSKCKTCVKREWYDRAEESPDTEQEYGYFVKVEDRVNDDILPYDKYVETMTEYNLKAAEYTENEEDEHLLGEVVSRGGERLIRRLRDSQEVWFGIDPKDGMEYELEDPHEIGVLSYMNDNLEWEKESLDYYAEDDILCESQHDEVIENREEIVGDVVAKDRFDGELSEDDHVIFVRNPRLRADYEVILHDSSYDKEVLGATDEEVEAARAFFGIEDSPDSEDQDE